MMVLFDTSSGTSCASNEPHIESRLSRKEHNKIQISCLLAFCCFTILPPYAKKNKKHFESDSQVIWHLVIISNESKNNYPISCSEAEMNKSLHFAQTCCSPAITVEGPKG